jgi:hypothetical protein
LNECDVAEPLDPSEEWYRREIGTALRIQVVVVSRKHLKIRANQGSTGTGTGTGTSTDDAALTKDPVPCPPPRHHGLQLAVWTANPLLCNSPERAVR